MWSPGIWRQMHRQAHCTTSTCVQCVIGLIRHSSLTAHCYQTSAQSEWNKFYQLKQTTNSLIQLCHHSLPHADETYALFHEVYSASVLWSVALRWYHSWVLARFICVLLTNHTLILANHTLRSRQLIFHARVHMLAMLHYLYSLTC